MRSAEPLILCGNLPCFRIPFLWDLPWALQPTKTKDGPMSLYSSRRAVSRFRLVLSSFGQHDGLRFAAVLPEETIAQAFADADADFAQDEDDIYTPALTLWAFLS